MSTKFCRRRISMRASAGYRGAAPPRRCKPRPTWCSPPSTSDDPAEWRGWGAGPVPRPLRLRQARRRTAPSTSPRRSRRHPRPRRQPRSRPPSPANRCAKSKNSGPRLCGEPASPITGDTTTDTPTHPISFRAASALRSWDDCSGTLRQRRPSATLILPTIRCVRPRTNLDRRSRASIRRQRPL